MSLALRMKLLSCLCACLLVCGPFARAQTQATRPRRVLTDSTDEAPTQQPPAADNVKLAHLSAEPTIRIGLATAARSVTISTTANTLNVTSEIGADAPAQTLASARVRIEPRVLAPLPAEPAHELFRVEIAAVETEAAAQELAREAHELIGTEPTVAHDAPTNAWRVSVGAPVERAAAEDLRTQLEEAGFAAVTIVSTSTNPKASASTNANTNSSRTNATQIASTKAPVLTRTSSRQTNADARASDNVHLAAHVAMPTRGLVVYAAGARPLMDARAPVLFASPDEQSAPVRFNEKPYRGRIEVFTNTHGALTVVNVIGLEDYVRGVVPNELSGGSYPALEALKAQAVAARTYAISHLRQFNAEGFDLLPSTRSQVYGGFSTEQALTTRAVQETRGLVATYNGAPINALYTSTCGGRTEDAEQIFGGAAVPYLRGRECAAENEQTARASFAPFTLETTRAPAALHTTEHLASAREAALLAVHGLPAGNAHLTDDWLDGNLATDEARTLLELVARLTHHPSPAITNDATRPPAFSTALALALDGESRGDVLLDSADVAYLLAFRDADDIPVRNRADVAYMLREGHLALWPDLTLRPRQPLTRTRALHAVAHALDARGLLSLQRSTARPSANGTLIIRPAKGSEHALTLDADAYLFRAFGESLYPVRSLNIVGGEPVAYHTDARGAVDYLEVRPPPNGAAADRFSPFANWTTTLSAAEVAHRLARSTGYVGAITDLRVDARGVSRRVLDLEVVGTQRTAHVRGGHIRSALGLREQLFVVDRRYDEAGRFVGFTFTGRGWGHGVGMCQVGAYGLARAGWTFDRILRHYYTGIELTKLY